MTDKLAVLDKKLKRLFLFYALVVAVLVVIVSVSVVVREHSLSVNQTLRELRRFQMNLAKVQAAAVDMNDAIQRINGMIPPDYFSISTERQLLTGLDLLKTNARNSVVIISEIVYGDTELSLPVTVKGYLSDYSDFVNEVGRLQSYKFPFYTIKDIAIKKEEATSAAEIETKPSNVRGRFIYEITGELRLPRSSQMVLGRTLEAAGSGQAPAPAVPPAASSATGAGNAGTTSPGGRVR